MGRLRDNSLFSDANLQAYWEMEGNSNDSKNTNNGTDTSVTYSTGNGKFNQGAGFNGTSSKIAVANNATLNVGTGNFSISLWVKLAGGLGSTQTFVNKYDGSNGWSVGKFTDNKLFFYRQSGATAQLLQAITTALTTGVWYHLVFVRSASNACTIYINGVAESTGAVTDITGSISNTGELQIGTYSANNEWTNGAIDDVALFNKALSLSEVQSLAFGVSPSASLSPSASRSPSASISPSISPSSSTSASISPSASSSPSISPSSSLSASISPSASVSPSISPSASVSPSSSISLSVSPSSSFSPSASVSPSISPSPSLGYTLYSRGSSSVLPGTNQDLDHTYTEQEYEAVYEEGTQLVGQKAQQMYMLHQFKNFVGANTMATIEWLGQSTLAPELSPVYLQLYNTVSHNWETIDSNNTSDEDRDFVLTKTLRDLTNYKENQLISCRVYQLAI